MVAADRDLVIPRKRQALCAFNKVQILIDERIRRLVKIIWTAMRAENKRHLEHLFDNRDDIINTRLQYQQTRLQEIERIQKDILTRVGKLEDLSRQHTASIKTHERFNQYSVEKLSKIVEAVYIVKEVISRNIKNGKLTPTERFNFDSIIAHVNSVTSLAITAVLGYYATPDDIMMEAFQNDPVKADLAACALYWGVSSIVTELSPVKRILHCFRECGRRTLGLGDGDCFVPPADKAESAIIKKFADGLVNVELLDEYMKLDNDTMHVQYHAPPPVPVEEGAPPVPQVEQSLASDCKSAEASQSRRSSKSSDDSVVNHVIDIPETIFY
eukprot:37667_1